MRANFLTCAILVVTLFSTIKAAEIEVSENPVPTESFAVVKYKLDEKDRVSWDVSPEPVNVKEYTEDGYSYLIFNGPKQRYTVNALVVNFKSEKFLKKRQYVVIGGKVEPVPPLPPNPNPPVPPIPDNGTVEGPVKLFIVEETSSRTTAITAMILDIPFWNDLEKEGYTMRVYDVSGTDAKRYQLDKIKDEKGNVRQVPFMVAASKDGTIIKSFPLPVTREGVKEKLPKIKVKLSLDEPTVMPSSVFQQTYYLPGSTVECVNGVCYPVNRRSK